MVNASSTSVYIPELGRVATDESSDEDDEVTIRISNCCKVCIVVKTLVAPIPSVLVRFLGSRREQSHFSIACHNLILYKLHLPISKQTRQTR
jgi:hypothetical protein